ncbi:MAG: cation-translocating P-type ATPase [Proteobacteria bacterium]|nr:cation-translocating P-type ATPase [Pseudomonadota bacterium]
MPWHAQSTDALLRELKTGTSGLSHAEAAKRLAQQGPNELEAGPQTSPWSILLRQLQNVLIVVLLIATALSAFLGHTIEAAAITVIVAFAVILGFVQEYRAERAIDALRRMAAPSATALRGGEWMEVPARELVGGDLIALKAGDRVPADARLIQVTNLKTDESALTGESVPVAKQTVALDADLAVADRTNLAYSGSSVTYGRGRALVVATGMSTEFGKIARMLATVELGRTPLQDNLDRVGRSLARAGLGVVAAIVVLGVLRGSAFIEMLVFGVALAVAVVPEALPAVVTISLALGVQRLVKRHALMRRLPAVETLGSTTIICTDKTGTLTKDEMTARKIWVDSELIDVSGTGYDPAGSFVRDGQPFDPSEPLLALLRAGALASDAELVRPAQEPRWTLRGDPTEGALVVAAAKAGLHKPELDARFPREDEIPFTSEAKRMTTLHRAPDGRLACAKGAPEIILSSCRRVASGAAVVPLDDQTRQRILTAAQDMAGQALRVLAVASKPDAEIQSAAQDMTFLGLVGMIDPPRDEVRDALRTCREAGIGVLMITGDHPVTAQAVAREIGLIGNDGGRAVTGPELAEMSDETLEREIESIRVYARVSPVQKLRIVTALQRRGHVVGMTGDGVNDAPALKKADIGVAMGITGTDVTKEAADMSLTDDNFASIVAAVEEGRGVFDNIKKFLGYLLASNIGEIGLVGGTALLGMPLPLTAVQILYVNLATDGLPAIALSVDPPDQDLMRRPPRTKQSSIFTRPLLALMLVAGLWSTAVNMGVFVWALKSGRPVDDAMTLTFVTLVLIQFFKAYNFRSDRHSVMRQPFNNRWLNLAIGWELVLLGLILYLPALHTPFGTFPLSGSDWTLTACASATIVPAVELAKWTIGRVWPEPASVTR